MKYKNLLFYKLKEKLLYYYILLVDYEFEFNSLRIDYFI